MSANIIAFPQNGSSASSLRRGSARASTPRGLYLIASNEALHQASAASQALAHRIVAQIEREIANRAYARAQNRLNLQPIFLEPQMEIPSSVSGRLLHALKSFFRAA